MDGLHCESGFDGPVPLRQGEVSRLTKRLQAQTELQWETPLHPQGSSMLKQARGSGIPYNTPPDELMPVRMARSPSPTRLAVRKSIGQSANVPPRWASSRRHDIA